MVPSPLAPALLLSLDHPDWEAAAWVEMLVAEALKYFDSDLPQMVIYANTEIDVVSDKLRGFVPNPTNMTNFCQSAGWWIAE